jgi:rubrerythrin
MSTTENLKTAFAGESQATNKYLAYADKAQREGFPVVARLFRAVAAAETVHAQNHFRALEAARSTLENLIDAQAGENYEVGEMYPPMLAEAETEGHKKAVRAIHFALEAEKIHSVLYGQAIAAVQAGHDLSDVKVYICPVCGHTVIGVAPDKCPICGCVGTKYQEFA